MKLIECELAQILISETSTAQVIVLQELDGDRRLSIDIGYIEAISINNAIHGVESPRPVTHDLMQNILFTLDTPLKYIIISELRSFDEGGIFYGLLILQQDDTEVEVDCRPSDAIALAVRSQSKIYLAAD